jgi:hypothetical protein
MNELRNIDFLKKLAKESGELAKEDVTPNEYWRGAYKQLARGSSLLWRLLEQQGGQEKYAEK